MYANLAVCVCVCACMFVHLHVCIQYINVFSGGGLSALVACLFKITGTQYTNLVAVCLSHQVF